LITSAKAQTFQTFLQVMWLSVRWFALLNYILFHHDSFPDGHHDGGMPLSKGYLLCGGSQCCINNDKSELNVVLGSFFNE